MTIIKGNIRLDGGGKVEFEFEVDNWENLTVEQKEEEFTQAVNESGQLEMWWEE